MSLQQLLHQLEELADPVIAEGSRRYFKTGPGDYAAGMQLRGIRVPALRALAKTHAQLPVADAFSLLQSDWHEDRMCALLLLVGHFECAEESIAAEIYQGYLARASFVNNWDLVDCSAPRIVGGWLAERPQERGILDELVASTLLWERRIAVLATFTSIRRGEFDDTLRLVGVLLDAHESEDLMHKACGWMLRELAKRDKTVACSFLDTNAPRMPRTMLRYAIEHFPPAERRHYRAMK